MDVKQTFATRLKALREKRGISQADLGEAIGMTRGSVSFYESGSRTPDIETLDKVHKYFDVSVNYLLGYSEAGREENERIGEQLGLSDLSIEFLKLCNQCKQIGQLPSSTERKEYFSNYTNIINRIIEQLCSNHYLLSLVIVCIDRVKEYPYNDDFFEDFEARENFQNLYPEPYEYLYKNKALVLFGGEARNFSIQELKDAASSFFRLIVTTEAETGIDKMQNEKFVESLCDQSLKSIKEYIKKVGSNHGVDSKKGALK